MQLVSLFSGIGGFEIAAEKIGWRVLSSCEINPFGREVLSHYWPQAYHHDNVSTLDINLLNHELTQRFGATWRSDDIVLTGGFPCQDASIAKQDGAGQRALSGARTGLFYEMCRVISEIKPRFVVAENVANILKTNGGADFSRILTELSGMGYNAEWRVCRASEVGAPHHRARLYLVAYPADCRLQEGQTFFSHVYEASSQISGVFDGTTVQAIRGGGWRDKPPAVCVDDGIPDRIFGYSQSQSRKHRIMAFGNAIVPQIAYQIFKAIDQLNYYAKT